MYKSHLIMLLLLCAGFLFPVQGECDGVIHEFKIGVLHHDTDGLWSGKRRESGLDLNMEAVFTPSTRFFFGTIRPALGGSLNSQGGTNKVYFDANWELDIVEKLKIATGLGVAFHNGQRDLVAKDRKAFGSEVLFHIPVEMIYCLDSHHAVSIYFDHISNGYLVRPNEAMDTLGMRYGYRF